MSCGVIANLTRVCVFLIHPCHPVGVCVDVLLGALIVVLERYRTDMLRQQGLGFLGIFAREAFAVFIDELAFIILVCAAAIGQVQGVVVEFLCIRIKLLALCLQFLSQLCILAVNVRHGGLQVGISLPVFGAHRLEPGLFAALVLFLLLGLLAGLGALLALQGEGGKGLLIVFGVRRRLKHGLQAGRQVVVDQQLHDL